MPKLYLSEHQMPYAPGAADLLRGAKALLEKGWTKNSFARTAAGYGGKQ
ncbi:MAG: hypothetical protein WC822_01105 [Candidatus Paceibacterota bacterium]|jgi:hypothetical protein